MDTKVSAVWENNYGKNMLNKDLLSLTDADIDYLAQHSEHLHLSPPCPNFSQSRNGKNGETENDIRLAQKCAQIIRRVQPSVLTLEEAAGYKGSKSYDTIIEAVQEVYGDNYDAEVYDASEYGASTHRERLYIRASNVGELPAMQKSEGQGWWNAVKDLEGTKDMPVSDHVPNWMQERMDNTPDLVSAMRNQTEPILVLEGTKGRQVTWAKGSEVSPSIRTSVTDARIFMPDGTVYRATPRALANIMGLPQDYKLPKTADTGYKVVGNGIPVQLTEAVVAPLLDQLRQSGKKMRFSTDIEFVSSYLAEKISARTIVRYDDESQKEILKQQKHSEMLDAGEYVKITEDDYKKLDVYFPKNEGKKRRERIESQKEAQSNFKQDMRAKLVSSILGDGFEVSLNANGDIYIATVNKKFPDHAVPREKKLTKFSAAAISKAESIFRTATYVCSSLHDVHSNASKNVQASVWDYFYCPVVDSKTDSNGIWISVRRELDEVERNQIYAWKMNKKISLRRLAHAANAETSRSDPSADEIILPNGDETVKQKNKENTEKHSSDIDYESASDMNRRINELSDKTIRSIVSERQQASKSSVMLADYDSPSIIGKKYARQAVSSKAKFSHDLYLNPAEKQRFSVGKSGNTGTLLTDKTTGQPLKMSGRAVLEQLLQRSKLDTSINAAEIKSGLKTLDSLADFVKKAELEFTFIGMQHINSAKLVISPRDGSIVLSALVKNGEYPVNFDLTKVCSRRLAMTEFIEELSHRPGRQGGDSMLSEIALTKDNLLKINDILKDAGYDTACLGCFVESRRANIQSWAESFVEKWNNAVRKYSSADAYFGFSHSDVDAYTLTSDQVSSLNDTLEDYTAEKNRKSKEKAAAKGQRSAALTNEENIDALVKTMPQMQKLLRVSDLITIDGRTNLHKVSPELESLILGHYGSNTPKSTELFTPYNNEIELMAPNVGDQTLQEYLFSIGGLRSQSFSDFIITHVFDVVQKTVGTASRGLPAQCYTKVPARARLFGMTGEKINLSVMFNIDTEADAAHAGLRADGTYFVGDKETSDAELERTGTRTFIQSFPWQEAIDIQRDPRYSKNCGIIGVGYSWYHNKKMLADSDIRYIIGYHRSGLPEELAIASHINLAADYTSVQNTYKINGFMRMDSKTLSERSEKGFAEVPSYATWQAGMKHGASATDFTFDLAKEAKRVGGKQALINLFKLANESDIYFNTSKAGNGHADFDLYGDLALTNDPRKTADNYINWCAENGWLPCFYEFADDPNYYKYLFDFNVYDCVTEKYAPQQAVKSVFPENMQDMVREYMTEYDEQRQYEQTVFEPTLNKIYEGTSVSNAQKYSYDISSTDAEPDLSESPIRSRVIHNALKEPTKKIAKLEEKVGSLSAELKELRNENLEMAEELGADRETINNLYEWMRDHADDITSLNDELRSVKKALSNSEKNADEYKKLYKQYKERLSQIKKEVKEKVELRHMTVELRESVVREAKGIMRMLMSPTESNHIPEAMRPYVNELMQSLSMTSATKKGDNTIAARDWRAKLLSLQNFMNNIDTAGINDEHRSMVNSFVVLDEDFKKEVTELLDYAFENGLSDINKLDAEHLAMLKSVLRRIRHMCVEVNTIQKGDKADSRSL